MSALSDSLPRPCGLCRTLLVGLAIGFALLEATWAAGPPVAPVVANRETERGAINAERRQVETSFDVANAACQGRFLLTQCLDEARTTRRLALDKLQRRQLTLDDAARRERSAQRLQTLQARARELGPSASSASTPAASAPASPGVTVRQAQQPVEQRALVAPDLPTAAANPATGARPSAASAQAQRNQAAYLQRQQQAAAHRDAVLARNARQAAIKPAAAGLPVPASAPASR